MILNKDLTSLVSRMKVIRSTTSLAEKYEWHCRGNNTLSHISSSVKAKKVHCPGNPLKTRKQSKKTKKDEKSEI